MSEEIVIDFHEYGLQAADISTVSENTVKALGERILHAFKTFGFCYVKNHGVDEALITDYLEASRRFFELPYEVKSKYAIGRDYAFGWVKLLGEHSDPSSKSGDLHEAFNYRPCSGYESWPPLEKFEALTKRMFTVGSDLTYRICDVLSLGLGQPLNFMRNAHALIGQPGSPTCVRTSYYPPIGTDWEIEPDQTRIGEHTDFTTVSLIFQDSVGGLEARNPEGHFVPVDPISGAAVLLAGPMLQRWTADSVMATRHTIPIPSPEQRKKARQSIVWYLHPDDDFVIKCLDGSNKYEPITSRGYINERIEFLFKEK